MRRYLMLAVISMVFLSACGSSQIYSNSRHTPLRLDPGMLSQGLAFLTPSTVRGKEEDKQTLALLFSDVLAREAPSIPRVTLPETLSAINQAGLSGVYQKMLADYQNTGIFEHRSLYNIGIAVGARYQAQLKLADFKQTTQGRFSAFGLRLFQTKQAHIRLFLQIWDSHAGTIVWEGVEELNYAYDTSSERPVSFRTIVEETAKRLIKRLP